VLEAPTESSIAVGPQSAAHLRDVESMIDDMHGLLLPDEAPLGVLVFRPDTPGEYRI